MQLIKTLFPKLRIVARGNVMKVIGDEDESELFLKKIREVEKYCEEFNSLSEDVILDIIKGKAPVITKQENLIIHGMNGKPIVARTENQQRLVKAFEENDLVFATGPAGTGKTFVAIALAVKALKNKEIRKIILSRPAVEAGEKLGFLPGEMKDKLDPYLQPLYDALQDMVPGAKLKEYSPVRQQSKMLEYHRHLLTAYLQQFLIRQRCDVPTAQPYLSHRGFVQPVNATHQRRLTTTGEPHYHEHLSFLYFQIGITDSYGTACFF